VSLADNRYRPHARSRGEDTRRRILETAIEVFANEGYEGATTRALAEQAEVSYQRMVTDQQAGRPSRKVGASATPERA